MVTPISMDWMVSSLLDTRHNRVQHAAPRPEQYSDCWDNCWVSTSTSWRNRMFSYNDTATESTKNERQKSLRSADCRRKYQFGLLGPFEQTKQKLLGRMQASGKPTSNASLRRLGQTWYRWWLLYYLLRF